MTTILLLLAGWVSTLIGVIIKIRVEDKKRDERLANMKDGLISTNLRLDKIETEHKNEIQEMNRTLKAVNENLIVLKTHMELLLMGKIKTGKQNDSQSGGG